MNVLFSTHTTPVIMPPPPLSATQVVCGPLFPDHSDGDGRVISLNTPRGEYDIARVAARLPASQRPDVLVVKADAYRMNLPLNIKALGIPAVVVIGDTHHMREPIKTLIRYAMMQRFQSHVFEFNRQHMHWFVKAGLQRVFWLPGFSLGNWLLNPSAGTGPGVCFVGQTGKFHELRQQRLAAIRQAGIPLSVTEVAMEQACRVYNRSRVSFNHSLNGDLNLRVYEILAAGGCLVTDALTPQSGLSTLFRDGRELVTYDSAEQLTRRLRQLMDDEGRRQRIAEQGHAAVMQNHHPGQNIRRLLDILAGAVPEDRYLAAADPRCDAYRDAAPVTLFNRIAQYEYLQELHRGRTRINAVFSPGSCPRLQCDSADLPRLHSHRAAERLPDLFTRAGVAGQVSRVSGDELVNPATGWDIAVTGSLECLSLAWRKLPARLLLSDWEQARRGDRQTLQQHLNQLGFQADHSLPGLFSCRGR